MKVRFEREREGVDRRREDRTMGPMVFVVRWWAKEVKVLGWVRERPYGVVYWYLDDVGKREFGTTSIDWWHIWRQRERQWWLTFPKQAKHISNSFHSVYSSD